MFHREIVSRMSSTMGCITMIDWHPFELKLIVGNRIGEIIVLVLIDHATKKELVLNGDIWIRHCHVKWID